MILLLIGVTLTMLTRDSASLLVFYTRSGFLFFSLVLNSANILLGLKHKYGSQKNSQTTWTR